MYVYRILYYIYVRRQCSYKNREKIKLKQTIYIEIWHNQQSNIYKFTKKKMPYKI